MNENEKKTIQIHPDFFQMSGANNKTRKQRQVKEKSTNKIQVKEKKPKKISTIKRNILKMIRNQQHEKKKMDKENPPDVVTVSSSKKDFDNDFNQTLEYLTTLTNENDEKMKKERHNFTFKNVPVIPNPIIPINQEPFIPLESDPKLEPIRLLPSPGYGCLKNGKLPTYRNWKTQTRNAPIPTLAQQLYEKKLENNIKDWSLIKQIQEKIPNTSSISTIPNLKKKHYKIPKQKRIIRRTFYVGRSRVFPKVSVLVANKTIRANTQLKTQNLKQIPIQEVKRYLLKNGFTKIGTNAPNDVLREMYENTQMICGEIKNHNPENLLYNYFNDKTDIQ